MWHPSVVKGAAKPSLGYTGAYVFANVLLTMAGNAILLLQWGGTVFAVLLVLLIAMGGVRVS